MGKLLFFIYGLFGFAVVVLLIYLLVKRLDNEKKEDFEKRDN